MDIIEHLQQRGLIAQLSAHQALSQHLESGMRTVYCGFDPTADSLHIGNLVPLLALRRFQLAGHRPLLLVGGATGMIGDPGGRDSERELQPKATITDWVERIRHQASQFLDFDSGATSAVLVNNASWNEELRVIDYLRDIGKHFSVNAMVQKESIKRRFEETTLGISYTEFSYLILQSYDFVVLNQRYDCTIQMGGSDQWGNITSGIELIRRMRKEQAFGITYPLVTKADGTKFGKTSGGAIWIDPEKTSPFCFYQFWRNTADDDVLKYLSLFTFLSAKELAALEASHQTNPGERIAHVALAREVTQRVHGAAGLQSAERITQAMFTNSLAELDADDLEQLAQDGMDTSHVKMPGKGLGLAALLVESGLALTPRGEVTMGQARKLITSNSVSVNGAKVADVALSLSKDAALFGRFFVIQKGKKAHHLVKIVD